MPGGIELRGKKATHGAPPHPAHLAALAAMAMWPALEQLCSLTAVLRPLEAWTAKALLGLVLGDGDASPRNTAFSSYRKFAEQGGVATVAWARNARARAPATRCGAPTRARARRRWPWSSFTTRSPRRLPPTRCTPAAARCSPSSSTRTTSR